MPQKAPHTVHILEGAATLYLRTKTPFWQVRYKVGSRWLRTTTKRKKLDDAKQAAVEIVMNAWYRQKNDLPVVSKRFKPVANLAIQRMQELIDNGQAKVSYKRYIQVTNKYLIPFFAQHNIDKIDYALLARFDAWRQIQMQGVPSQSAINTHNAALGRVFEEALMRGYMQKIQVPYLQNKGVEVARRDDFTAEEYIELCKYMRKWQYKAREGHEFWVRSLLRDYVLLVANTGIRPGTEGMNLKWQHVMLVKHNNVEYLTLNIKGKKKRMREIQVRPKVASYLRRIQMRDEELKHMSFKQLIAASVDKYVFRINGKDMTSNFGRMFKRMLTEAKLLVDKRSGNDRTLYCLRHYYATRMITKGNVTTAQLAAYMGTSEKMIEDYYGHLNLREVAGNFAGLGRLDDVLTLDRLR
jgi:integrase